jgi:hypothetical protein
MLLPTPERRQARILDNLAKGGGREIRMTPASGAWMYVPKRMKGNTVLRQSMRIKYRESDARALIYWGKIVFVGYAHSGARRYVLREETNA